MREAIRAALSGSRWALLPQNVIVSNGVVHLWGAISSEEGRKAICVTAGNVAGVKEVKNHLDLQWPFARQHNCAYILCHTVTCFWFNALNGAIYATEAPQGDRGGHEGRPGGALRVPLSAAPVPAAFGGNRARRGCDAAAVHADAAHARVSRPRLGHRGRTR
ncbi:BON domain-containing protein [Paraburkholderia tagetis]|uniref:BON domain-containing protein n=1 Tax=Paraburkholderia tagetis TaxID=2913261 RepID=A0A9X1RVL8_9BURK|nr:BON domain-containing protein [Paraburkholderia tagetis]MCG5076917.1 BON domain-containing protein [Paraburkholderia tagetis]